MIQTVKDITMSADEVLNMKRNIIETSMRKYVISTLAKKEKIYEIVKDYIFPWVEDIRIENKDEFLDVVWVVFSGSVEIPFNFVWEKSKILSDGYKLAKVF